jgi:hypothetical protein
MATTTMIPPSKSAPTETATVPDEERGVMRDVSWDFYDRLTDAMGEGCHIRVAYDGKDMEIMTLGPKHEQSKELLGSFIEAVAEGLEVDYQALGSTTWKRAAEQCRVRSMLLLRSGQARSHRRGGLPGFQRRRRLSQSRPCRRNRDLAIEDRPADDLCRAQSPRDLAVPGQRHFDRTAPAERGLSGGDREPIPACPAR